MAPAKAAVDAYVQIMASLKVIPHSHLDVLLLALACDLWNVPSWELDVPRLQFEQSLDWARKGLQLPVGFTVGFSGH